jgi:hypothetical protein
MNPNVYQRYERYRRWCIHVLGVYPASFAIWKQIEPVLAEKRRIAVLDDLIVGDGVDCGRMKKRTGILDDLIFAEV